jgi:hypothetical protein
VVVNNLLCTDEKELKEMNHNELIERVIAVAKAAKKYQGQLQQAQSFLKEAKEELKQQQQIMTNYKIAFADRMFESYEKTANQPHIQETKSYAAATKGATNNAANHKHAQSTLAFSIDSSGADKELNIKLIDTFLDAKAAGNPVPLSVNRKDDKGYITFPNQEDAEKARMILTNSTTCRGIINDLKTQIKLYPAIGLFAPEGDLKELKEEIEFRNGFIADSLVKIVQIHKCKEPDLIHIKLFFNSPEVRDEAIYRAKIHTSMKKIKIVPIDVNREVRRCYKCNKYGHTSTRCNATTATCGKCGQNHDTRSCKATIYKCPNCKLSHIAGDLKCPEQIKAVNRYRTLFSL